MISHAFKPGRLVLLALGLALSLSFMLTPPSWGSAGCPNEQFRTGPSETLPDCRAYEQVSPQQKNGGNVDGGVVEATEPAPNQAAANGNSVTYASQTAFAGLDPQSAMASSQYYSTRTSSGWRTEAIMPVQDVPQGRLNTSSWNLDEAPYEGFSEDLHHAYLDAFDPPVVSGAPEGFVNPYIRDNLTGGYSLLSSLTPPSFTAGESPNCCDGFFPYYAGMSADGSHAIFEANDALTPEAAAGRTNLYEWNEGQLELVSRLPDGKTDEGGTERVQGSVLKFGSPAEEFSGQEAWNFDHAISSDGRRVFWTGSDHRLYMRELAPGGPRTIEVSASQNPGAKTTFAHYWTASSDGSVVYFTSCDRLTSDSTAVPSEECFHNGVYPIAAVGQDLYRYEVDSGRLVDITTDPNVGDTADVQGVLGASADGSYVYFAANGVLADGAVPGVDNIYVWHDGRIALVAALDRGFFGPRNDGSYNETYMWDQSTFYRSGTVSPSGRYLAFNSTRPLTGYDSRPAYTGACDNPAQGELGLYSMENEFGRFTGEEREYGGAIIRHAQDCVEVFEFDAAGGTLSCVSCDQRGLAPTGNSILPMSLNKAQTTDGWQSTTVPARRLLNDGSVFFDSTASLAGQDTNGTLDVYEYEPAGVRGCVGSRSCVSLISGGKSTAASQFVDAGADGNDVFFETFDKLASQDGDEHGDLYDARVDGGFSTLAPPPCLGEACRPAISPAPSIYGAPSSQAFVGSGNPTGGPSDVKVKVTKKTSKKAKGKGRKTRRRSHRARKVKRRSSGLRHGNGRSK